MTDSYTEKALPALRLVAAGTVVASMDEVGPAVGPLFDALFGSLGRAGVRPAAPPLCWYDARPDGATEVNAGLPHDGPVAGLDEHVLPAAERAVCTVHRGSMATIGTAWQELMAHVDKLGLAPAGSAREIYLSSPVDAPDAWVTELQVPVVGGRPVR